MNQRCPACNPMHGSGGLSEGGQSGFFAKRRASGQGRHASRKVCMLCKNTRECSVEVAQKYIHALRWPEEKGRGPGVGL